jgi:hypothetical protein
MKYLSVILAVAFAPALPDIATAANPGCIIHVAGQGGGPCYLRCIRDEYGRCRWVWVCPR